MTVDELPDRLRANWPEVQEQLLAGRYQPQPVKRQTIPKSSGGERELGIPTVLDRFIQQALLQVLQPQFDPRHDGHGLVGSGLAGVDHAQWRLAGALAK